jgi:hypothetical protein
MKPRFNKDNVLIHIELKMKQLEEKWGFNPSNGWSQVKGESIEKIVAYGEYDGLEKLHSDFWYSNLKGVK